MNRSSTRIELLWNVRSSASLTHETKTRLLEKLAHRVDGNGCIRVVSSERRSQLRNSLAAELKLVDLLRRALHTPKPRRASKPTKASVERRLDAKRRQSERKREREWRED